MTAGDSRDPIRAGEPSMKGMGEAALAERTDAAEPSLDEQARSAAAGDAEAARSLLLAVLPRVRNLVRYLVRGDDVADDVAQDVLAKLLRKLPTFRGEGAFVSWADRVAARTVFAALRQRRADRERESAAGPELEDVPGELPDPEEYIARRRAVRALDELPGEQRHAVVLHHVLGMSVPEIAAELAVPAETVRSRLRLGMRRLRGTGEVAAAEREEV
jgi:RNA polymerase sigma-70 factor (ECF subfamily)